MRLINKISAITLSFLLLFSVITTPAFAIGENWNDIVPGCVEDGVPSLQCIPALFKNIVTAALIFAGIVALILVIISGIKLITSSGDAKQVEGAKNTLTYAIIGLILILLSFLIIKIIAYVTGAECITAFGFKSCTPE